LVREGRGLNRSAGEAGIGKETGYRWLREAYVAHRRGGKSIAETEAVTRESWSKRRRTTLEMNDVGCAPLVTTSGGPALGDA
jgi:hypothetical protein